MTAPNDSVKEAARALAEARASDPSDALAIRKHAEAYAQALRDTGAKVVEVRSQLEIMGTPPDIIDAVAPRPRMSGPESSGITMSWSDVDSPSRGGSPSAGTGISAPRRHAAPPRKVGIIAIIIILASLLSLVDKFDRAYPNAGTETRCGECGKRVSSFSGVGETCPHCGAKWDFSNTQTRRR